MLTYKGLAIVANHASAILKMATAVDPVDTDSAKDEVMRNAAEAFFKTYPDSPLKKLFEVGSC